MAGKTLTNRTLLGAGFCVILLLFALWRGLWFPQAADEPVNGGNAGGSVKGAGETAAIDGGGADVQGKSGRPRQDGDAEESTEDDGPQFPLVDALIDDEQLSVGETAKRLREIVEREDVPLAEREEAVAHGLNLDFATFVDLANVTTLPQPVAQRLFDETLNQNDARDLQVRVCMGLMDHEDETLREEAAEQLGFYIGREEWVEQPEVLKQEARLFLEDWASRPKEVGEPEEPDQGIPETAPIDNGGEGDVGGLSADGNGASVEAGAAAGPQGEEE